jgi:hypothetical protein
LSIVTRTEPAISDGDEPAAEHEQERERRAAAARLPRGAPVELRAQPRDLVVELGDLVGRSDVCHTAIFVPRGWLGITKTG